MPRAASSRDGGWSGRIVRSRPGWPGRRPRPAPDSRGYLLTGARLETAVAWARRGLGAVTVAELHGWTVITPTGPARARYPYDDAVRSLAGRPVSHWMRPALGFYRVGRQGVVTVHPAGWHPVQRWAIWTPREGLVPPAGLAPARPGDLLHAAGAPAERVAALRSAFSSHRADAGQVLREVLDVLALPGYELLSGAIAPGDLPGARTVDPPPRHARAFDRLLTEEQRHLTDVEA